jgi:oligopeptide transport system permease protein
MTGYILRRILWIIPVLWVVATVTFFLMHAVPGGPFTEERPLPPQILDALNRRYELDQPIWRQYLSYLWGLLHLDLGLSFRGDRDVADVIRGGFFVTAQLGFLSMLLSLTAGLTLGTLSAVNRRGFFDYLGVAVATLGASVPSFVLASVLIVVFGVELGWFQVLGWGGPTHVSDFFDPGAWNLRKIVLPVVALSALPMAYIARVTRASLLEVLDQDYIRAAYAKGLTQRTVILRHALKNAMIPVLTITGPMAAAFVTGSFVIESAFSIPGIGRAFVDALGQRDYGVIMGMTLFYTAAVTFANLAVDILYSVFDPRVRYG